MQESLEASLVRIHTADGRVVGAGFLVGERHILTCAHVISQALDLAGSPVDLPPGVVLLDFPRIPPHTLLTARVVLWCPPLPDGSGDLAGLELEREPPTGAERVRFASAEDVWKHDFSVLGFPEGYDDGVWATGRLLRRQATDWIQIEDVKAQGFAVGPGFSGTPVWDEQLQGVVGMVVAASRPADTRTAFVIPLEVLAAAWPLLTVPLGQPRNPYKGLRPFTQRDAADFFGREAVVEKVANLVNSLVTEQPTRSSTRLLTILGPSGVGKSSLVMAGLLPKLRQGALPGSKEWVYLDPLLPGKHPIEALASTLKPQFLDTSFKTLREDLEDEAARGLHLLATQLAKQRGTSVVLLIDQFEELFTQTESEDERQRFIGLLLNACSEPRGALLVLLTLRADFYDRPMQYPDLFRLIEAQHLSLLAIEPDDLRRVVEQPAALPDVQVTFEGDLVNRLLFEVQGQIGALPLLQFTLDQLFQRHIGRQLTLSAYRELGGVKGALTRQAEETYAALPSEEHRKLARALFVRLIDPGASEQDTTRRRAALSEFSLAEASQTRLLQEVTDTFIAVRLLTTNEIAGTTTIEVSHEALIREWTRLSDWLWEARDDVRLQQAVSEDATEWEHRQRPKDRLYRGSQLREAQAWTKRNLPSSSERAFLRASAIRRAQSLVGLALVILLMLSLVSAVGWYALNRPPDPTIVTNLSDSEQGSLRWCIANARSGSTIRFDPSVRGTIKLTGNLIFVGGKRITIHGPGQGLLTISSVDTDVVIRVAKGASVTISDLSVKRNEHFTKLILNEGNLQINDVTVSNNVVGLLSDPTSNMAGDYIVGDIVFNSGTLMMANSTITNNEDANGITNAYTGTLMVTNSTISRNVNGIYNQDEGIFNVINSTISDNKAHGIENHQESEAIVVGSTISGNNSGTPGLIAGENFNLALQEGGGISNYGGHVTLVNSTISGNRTDTKGGGIYNSSRKASGVIDITFCTIYGNTASEGGGGIWNEAIDTGLVEVSYMQVKIRNSIVAANHAPQGPDVSGALFSEGYNLIQNFTGAVFDASNRLHATDKDKSQFGDLKLKIISMPNNNSGSAQILALDEGSAAINAVPQEACHPTIHVIDYRGHILINLSITTDQRGVKRPDGNEQLCDIGAYEYVDAPT